MGETSDDQEIRRGISAERRGASWGKTRLVLCSADWFRSAGGLSVYTMSVLDKGDDRNLAPSSQGHVTHIG